MTTRVGIVASMCFAIATWACGEDRTAYLALPHGPPAVPYEGANPPPASPPPAEDFDDLPKREQPKVPTGPRQSIAFGDDEPSLASLSGRQTIGASLVATGSNPQGVSYTTDIAIEQREAWHIDLGRSLNEVMITFDESVDTSLHDGKEKRVVTPIAGRTYRVTIAPDGVTITDAKGGKLSKAELDRLQPRFAGLGGHDRHARAAGLQSMAGQTLAVGDRAQPLEAMLRKQLAKGAEGVKFGEVSATLAGTRDAGGQPCGLFRTRAQIAMTSSDLTVIMDLRGDVLVRLADGVVAKMDLAGPARLVGSKSGVHLDSEGNAVVRMALGPR